MAMKHVSTMFNVFIVDDTGGIEIDVPTSQLLCKIFLCSLLQVFRIKPPMCITEDDARYTVAVLRKALKEQS